MNKTLFLPVKESCLKKDIVFCIINTVNKISTNKCGKESKPKINKKRSTKTKVTYAINIMPKTTEDK